MEARARGRRRATTGRRKNRKQIEMVEVPGRERTTARMYIRPSLVSGENKHIGFTPTKLEIMVAKNRRLRWSKSHCKELLIITGYGNNKNICKTGGI